MVSAGLCLQIYHFYWTINPSNVSIPNLFCYNICVSYFGLVSNSNQFFRDGQQCSSNTGSNARQITANNTRSHSSAHSLSYPNIAAIVYWTKAQRLYCLDCSNCFEYWPCILALSPLWSLCECAHLCLLFFWCKIPEFLWWNWTEFETDIVVSLQKHTKQTAPFAPAQTGVTLRKYARKRIHKQESNF